MKYYCKNCKTEVYVPEKEDPIFHCPICFTRSYPNCPIRLYPIPAYETVAQWEERTGEQYPDSAPVYVRIRLAQRYWRLFYYGETDAPYAETDIIVATSAGAPPNDWRPA